MVIPCLSSILAILTLFLPNVQFFFVIHLWNAPVFNPGSKGSSVLFPFSLYPFSTWRVEQERMAQWSRKRERMEWI